MYDVSRINSATVCVCVCVCVCVDSTPTLPALFIFESLKSFEIRSDIITSETFVFFGDEISEELVKYNLT